MTYVARSQIPSRFESFRTWILDELRRIGQESSHPNPESLDLAELHAPPNKITEGMIVFADGTDWNPGSGQGIYARYGGAWNRLG